MKKEKEENYLSNTFVIKLNEHSKYRTAPRSAEILKEFLSSIRATSCKSLFPHLSGNDKYAQDLSKVMVIQYQGNESVQTICKRIYELGIVEYAEPYYIFSVFYIPNDPLIGQGLFQGDTLQYYLERVRAYEAWDLMQGNPDVIIGVVDDGIQLHEDLTENMHLNSNDPIDGLDNDHDGYTDNYRGWDIGDDDSDPIGNQHGVYVSGVCCAKPDNNTGIAGLGFNTKFMPIKASSSTHEGLPNPGKYITHGYEGVVYAADHGCKVINLSWGSNDRSYLMEELINYAVEEKDVVVVAAAGNSNNEDLFYPASYEKVFSVASCSTSFSPEYNQYVESKANFSNYNYEVDICAPGLAMYTTTGTSGYMYTHGTSLSAPMVSAAAALVRAKYPSLTALQVKELLRATADVIDTIPMNQAYKGKLGSGKLNLYKALSSTTTPSVRIKNYSIQTGISGNDVIQGEVVSLTGDLINYLHPTQNLYVKLSTETPYVDIAQSLFHAGNILTMQSKTLPPSNLAFTIQRYVTFNERILFKVEFIDSTLQYHDTQYLSFVLNPDFKTHDKNKITLTVGANGRFGFIERSELGTGLIYQHQSYLFEGGLMVGYSASDVSDCIRGEQKGKIEEDFYTRVPVTVKKETANEQEFWSESKDHAGKVEIKQTSVASNTPFLDQFVLLEYEIKNSSAADLANVHIGLFADWDIDNANSNSCEYDLTTNVIHATDGSTYCGIALISDHLIQGNCIDNDGSGPIFPNDGFSTEEKFTSLSNTQITSISGKDISMTMGINISSLKSQESKKIAFGLLIGNSQLEIEQAADSARKYYEERNKPVIPSDEIPMVAYPNPFNEELTLDLTSLKDKRCTITLTDLLGQKVFSDQLLADKNFKKLKLGNLQEGIYILEVSSENKKIRQKIIRSAN